MKKIFNFGHMKDRMERKPGDRLLTMANKVLTGGRNAPNSDDILHEFLHALPEDLKAFLDTFGQDKLMRFINNDIVDQACIKNICRNIIDKHHLVEVAFEAEFFQLLLTHPKVQADINEIMDGLFDYIIDKDQTELLRTLLSCHWAMGHFSRSFVYAHRNQSLVDHFCFLKKMELLKVACENEDIQKIIASRDNQLIKDLLDPRMGDYEDVVLYLLDLEEVKKTIHGTGERNHTAFYTAILFNQFEVVSKLAKLENVRDHIRNGRDQGVEKLVANFETTCENTLDTACLIASFPFLKLPGSRIEALLGRMETYVKDPSETYSFFIRCSDLPFIRVAAEARRSIAISLQSAFQKFYLVKKLRKMWSALYVLESGNKSECFLVKAKGSSQNLTFAHKKLPITVFEKILVYALEPEEREMLSPLMLRYAMTSFRYPEGVDPVEARMFEMGCPTQPAESAPVEGEAMAGYKA